MLRPVFCEAKLRFNAPRLHGRAANEVCDQPFQRSWSQAKPAARLCIQGGSKGFCLQNPANPERTHWNAPTERPVMF